MAQTRLPISVCIVAANEAHRIARTLESVEPWTSEIILAIDDSVKDGTDKIAASYGAKVVSRRWTTCAAHRNFASTHATQEWLLAIDADEVVSDELRGEIAAAFTNHADRPPPAAYSFPRLSYFCGRWIRHGDWYPDRKVRLWRKGLGEWQGDPHEKLVVNGPVAMLRGDLFHYSMEGLDHYVRKTITFSNLFVRQQLERGRKAGGFEMWIRSCWRFVRGYFLRLGFLDGWQGYVIARMIAFETFLRYTKLREAQMSKTANTNGPQNP